MRKIRLKQGRNENYVEPHYGFTWKWNVKQAKLEWIFFYFHNKKYIHPSKSDEILVKKAITLNFSKQVIMFF